jgi:hypothetical protein
MSSKHSIINYNIKKVVIIMAVLEVEVARPTARDLRPRIIMGDLSPFTSPFNDWGSPVYTAIGPGFTRYDGHPVWVQSTYASLEDGDPNHPPTTHPLGTVERSGIVPDKVEVVRRVITGNRAEPPATPAVRRGSFLAMPYHAALLPTAGQMMF